MTQEIPLSEPILWLRFIGKELQARSVPISELAQSMLALQQILSKAYLRETDSQQRASVRKHEERRKVALQLATRRRESDAYGFSALLADPLVTTLLAPLLVEAVSSLLAYTGEKIWEIIRRGASKKEAPHPEKLPDLVHVAVIYRPVLALSRRINRYSGVEALEILAPQTELPAARITRETSRYVRSLAAETYLGSPLSLRGRVKSLLYDRNLALIEQPHGHDLRAHLSAEDFDHLRRAPRNAAITFHGQPRFHLGAKTPGFREFEVERWEL